jgi:uncharacterized protein YbjT (DUF2867 family)
MMSNSEKTIVVTGATGQQGGATARHLLAQGWRVRALTRDPQGAAAQALAAVGAEVVSGNMDDRTSLDQAFAGAYGVFSVQNFWLPDVGAAGEVRQGKIVADAAKAAGVRHLVYTSVGGAERQTGLSHFDSKWQIEEYVRSLSLPATVLRPVFFMENLTSPMMGPRDGVLANALRPTTSLQMIAVEDIGFFAALAFARPQEFIGKAIELAGDSLTMPQVAETMTRVTGQPVQFVEVPLEQVAAFSQETADMLAWFNDHGYEADIAGLRKLHPGMLTFETLLRKTS